MRGLVFSLVLLAAVARGEPATVKVVSEPPGAVISIDGVLQGLAPRTATLPEGVHTFTAELGEASVSQTLTLGAGAPRTVRLALRQAPPPRPFPTAGVLTTAGGALLLGVGLLLRLPAQDAAREVSLLYQRGGTWDAQAGALEAAGLSAQTWSWLFTGFGGAVLASGLLVSGLQLFGAPPGPPPVALVAWGQGAGLTWSGRW